MRSIVLMLETSLHKHLESGVKGRRRKFRLEMRRRNNGSRRPLQKQNALSISFTRNITPKRKEISRKTSVCNHYVTLIAAHGFRRQQEAEYLASNVDALSNGTVWSRICDYIDLQNSQSKTLARTGLGTSDLSRFKEVLLRLKREGASAPGAGGY